MLQTAKRQVSQTYTMQAPTGGLNAVDAYANMPETDAIILDNWFPQVSYCELRNGYSTWVTGFSAWVESLFTYSNASGEKLFAVSGTSVYDATSRGAVGGAVVTSLTNARWESTNMATSGGQYLYAANAVDAPLLYDGTNWVKVTGVSTPAITGVTTTTLRNPTVWKNRVWFVQDATMKAWYLPTGSIGGAAVAFDFSPIFRLGGQLQTIMTASLTNGSTFDDYIFFVSSEGEVAMYAGTDPAQAGLFVLQGVYPVGKPVGRRCWFKKGPDAVLICADGFVSMSQMISVGKDQGPQATTISYKILNLVNQDVQNYNANFGWQGVVHPLGNKIVVNVPQSQNNTQYQYVMNQVNGSWCRFTGWNAACWAVLGNSMYFGGSTYVALADSGVSDNGVNITGTAKTAFSYMKSVQQKMYTMVRPLLSVTGDTTAAVAINTDFSDQLPALFPSSLPASGSAWDISPWDTSPWTVGFFLEKNWYTVSGIGFSASLYIQVASNSAQIRLQATDWLFQPGAVL